MAKVLSDTTNTDFPIFPRARLTKILRIVLFDTTNKIARVLPQTGGCLLLFDTTKKTNQNRRKRTTSPTDLQKWDGSAALPLVRVPGVSRGDGDREGRSGRYNAPRVGLVEPRLTSCFLVRSPVVRWCSLLAGMVSRRRPMRFQWTVEVTPA